MSSSVTLQSAPGVMTAPQPDDHHPAQTLFKPLKWFKRSLTCPQLSDWADIFKQKTLISSAFLQQKLVMGAGGDRRRGGEEEG